jgi:hypothetical protein
MRVFMVVGSFTEFGWWRAVIHAIPERIVRPAGLLDALAASCVGPSISIVRLAMLLSGQVVANRPGQVLDVRNLKAALSGDGFRG